mgnify:FL=1
MMRLLITAVLVLESLIAHADTSIKTGEVESWGYAQEKLVLITKSGDELKVTPKLCSVAAFSETLASGSELTLSIPAERVRINTPFYVQGAAKASKMKCKVARIEV